MLDPPRRKHLNLRNSHPDLDPRRQVVKVSAEKNSALRDCESLNLVEIRFLWLCLGR